MDRCKNIVEKRNSSCHYAGREILFFVGNCGGSHTCWVDAGFIEELRKRELQDG